MSHSFTNYLLLYWIFKLNHKFWMKHVCVVTVVVIKFKNTFKKLQRLAIKFYYWTDIVHRSTTRIFYGFFICASPICADLVYNYLCEVTLLEIYTLPIEVAYLRFTLTSLIFLARNGKKEIRLGLKKQFGEVVIWWKGYF